jgi:hypothetical protein
MLETHYPAQRLDREHENRLLKDALALSQLACFGACGGRHATLVCRDVEVVAEQILALNHDVAETPIRNMMRRSGGIAACRSPSTRVLPKPEKLSSRARRRCRQREQAPGGAR